MKKTIAKPFLKWAGGKTQLIEKIANVIPYKYHQKPFTYVEPFLGGGAMLFWILQRFPNIQKAIVNDINPDLVNTYRVIASHVLELITQLESLEREFHLLEQDEDGKKSYYYQKREIYNSRSSESVFHAALFIFLNRTCFNGLYRVNRSNDYNVPMGSYRKPMICDRENLIAVSRVLQKAEILQGDFEKTLDYVGEESLFYLDPPYKPISSTASFNSYAKDDFDDKEQTRLRNFCQKLDSLGYTWILSNSDVNCGEQENNFFDDLYSSFQINRVNASRRINSNAEKRGILTELLITNSHEKNQTTLL